MLKKTTFLILIYLLAVPAGFCATISAGTYQFLDHPDGALFDYGPYGLRLDFLDDDIYELAPKGPTFSVQKGGASVYLTWDDSIGMESATISGTIYNNVTGGLWSVSHILTGITKQANGGFQATGGAMTLTDPFNMNYILDSKQNSSGVAYTFAADNHRCNGHDDCGPINARGWIMEYGTNDWLVQAVPVPLPAALPLFLTGLFGLLRYKRVTS